MKHSVQKTKSPEYVDTLTGEILYVKTARTARDYASEGIDFSKDPGLTEQAHEKECNLNYIVARFTKDQHMEMINRSLQMFSQPGQTIDFTQGPQSYQEALNLVLKVGEKFDALPALVRAEYANDPSRFAAALNKDPEGVYKRAEALMAPKVPNDPPKPSEVAPSPVKEVVPPKEDKKS